ncbi:hypothetical protein [Cesiribacter andamanensis]|uniref:Uncharacterized protein n=1 Tax=Cesiribacter andamanensis AMV16 TaxID=1279009 RepID=M7N3W2_9BACT|nr:hypothetical protein [Cesiribacter andamanensis]EMR03353.1 hypothetical protein ADICEAN_01531 [Cesiribacter andamanensis AMV16]
MRSYWPISGSATPQQEDFIDATVTARVNGLLYGGSSAARLDTSPALAALPAQEQALVRHALAVL